MHGLHRIERDLRLLCQRQKFFQVFVIQRQRAFGQAFFMSHMAQIGLNPFGVTRGHGGFACWGASV